MKAKDRAAILATLPIDERHGPLIVDDNQTPVKPGMLVGDEAQQGEVTGIREDEGLVFVDVTWGEPNPCDEAYFAYRHIDDYLYTGIHGIETLTVNDFDVLLDERGSPRRTPITAVIREQRRIRAQRREADDRCKRAEQVSVERDGPR